MTTYVGFRKRLADAMVVWRLHLIYSFHCQSWWCKQGHSQAASRLQMPNMQGAAAILRRADALRELLQSKFLFCVCEEDNLQLGNRAFYVPPSPVIGCHWSCVRGGKRLHGSFPDFPGHFFPLSLFSPQPHSHSTWRPNPTRRSALP